MTIVKEDFYDNGKHRGSYYYPFSKAGDKFGGGTATSVQPNLLAFTYESINLSRLLNNLNHVLKAL